MDDIIIIENNVHLRERLSACAAFVRAGARVADIGTDHGLLPAYLVRNGIAPSAIAADINPEPLSRAEACIARCGLNEKITAVLSDGLENISPEQADDIVIAGMGGDLITRILAAAEWVRNERYRFILQPMSKADRLRAWLCMNGFIIERERCLRDAGKCYSVMCCRWTGAAKEKPSVIERYCGELIDKCEDREENAVRKIYLRRVLVQLNDCLDGCRAKNDAAGAEELTRAINMINGRIADE